MSKKPHRSSSFWNSEMPLTSKRARIVISNPEEGKKLMKVLRASRQPNAGEKASIVSFSERTTKKILAL